MRIVLISLWHPEYTISLANALSEKEEVILFLPDKANNKLLIKKFVNSNIDLILWKHKRVRNLISILRTCQVLVKIYLKKPNIIHIQSGNPWFNLLLPMLNGKFPLISTIHDVQTHLGDKDSRKTDLLRDRLITKSSQIIVHGLKLKRDLINSKKAESKAVHVIPHGELSIYKKFMNEKYEEEDYTILFFGRIWPYKGLKYLIDAEPLITNQIPQVKIIIAGKGEDFKAYEKMIIHKDRFCVYNEYISIEKVSKLFQIASIVVLPYVEGSQSGVVPIAYSFKKPVVVTAIGSIQEIVKDGKTGFVVKPRNSHQLAAAIIKLLKDKELRKKFGENAYRMTQHELSWKSIARKTISVYSKAMN